MYNLNQETPFDTIEPHHHILHRMFIAYEDRSAITRGKELQFELAHKCGAEGAVAANCWNFALFNNSRLREQAAIEAAQSDLLVISASDTAKLPPQFRIWIQEWLAQKQPGKAALVALLDSAPEINCAPGVSDFLWRAAKKFRIDFFCNRKELGISLAGAAGLKRLKQRGLRLTPVEFHAR